MDSKQYKIKLEQTASIYMAAKDRLKLELTYTKSRVKEFATALFNYVHLRTVGLIGMYFKK